MENQISIIQTLPTRLSIIDTFEYVWRYDVPWSDQGLHEGDETHVAYVKNFAADFKKAIIEKIQNAMDVEPLPHPHTTEVLAHGHMCFTRAKVSKNHPSLPVNLLLTLAAGVNPLVAISL